MCESNAFILGADGKKEVMRDVSNISIDGTRAVLVDIVGQKLILIGVRVKEMNLVGHEIVFEKM
ncbi:MAG: CooT family nickel-binding protein [Euryarchaeota archaeon]|nr:CooT family nickel-binding protein [Euryarchaeota archaeon]